MRSLCMESWLILQTLQQFGMSLFVCRTVTKHDNESSVEGQALAAATCVRTTKAITAVKEITSEPHQEANNFIARNEHRRPDAVTSQIAVCWAAEGEGGGSRVGGGSSRDQGRRREGGETIYGAPIEEIYEERHVPRRTGTGSSASPLFDDTTSFALS
ncbi:hypothetical protein KGM_206503 [Danaus plexippus plexippus]|uniref:Uncharacterized protein n=1 Tax=Danaus plexippus plexippus TaxID=278856 RepID=A0A212F148_DANPL|nr:hypothetical protein KGM_206503 [Danaus plexippus plexippus]